MNIRMPKENLGTCSTEGQTTVFKKECKQNT